MEISTPKKYQSPFSPEDEQLSKEDQEKVSYLNHEIQDLLSKISKVTSQFQNRSTQVKKSILSPSIRSKNGEKYQFSGKRIVRKQDNYAKTMVKKPQLSNKNQLQFATEGISPFLLNNNKSLKHETSLKILQSQSILKIPKINKSLRTQSLRDITPDFTQKNTTPLTKSLKLDSLFNKAMVRQIANSRIISEEDTKQQQLDSYSFKKLGQTRHTSASSQMTSQIIQQISLKDFQLGKLVGSGKFGEVYLCKHKPTGTLYALKKVFKSMIKQYKMQSQFTNELKTLYFLNHPNIIKLYTHFHDEFHVFLLMQYIEGGELLKKVRNSESYISKVTEQVVNAIQYIHHHGVIHRDIKPQNIIVSFDDTIKLCDFGWAANFDEKVLKKTFCGTLDYISPQMKDNKSYSLQVDLWSIGVLVFQMLTGTAPFKQQLQYWRKNGNNKINDINWHILYPPSISGLAESFIRNLLKPNPNERATIRNCKQHFFLKKYREYTRPLDLGSLQI